MSDSNKGQVALVTGATRGLGAAIAAALKAQGMTVIGTATTQQGAEKISAAGMVGVVTVGVFAYQRAQVCLLGTPTGVRTLSFD